MADPWLAGAEKACEQALDSPHPAHYLDLASAHALIGIGRQLERIADLIVLSDEEAADGDSRS